MHKVIVSRSHSLLNLSRSKHWLKEKIPFLDQVFASIHTFCSVPQFSPHNLIQQYIPLFDVAVELPCLAPHSLCIGYMTMN